MYQTDIRFVYLLQSCLHARDLIIRSEISHGASPVCSRKQRRNREPQTAAHRQFSDKAHHKSAIILGQARNRTAAASLFRAGSVHCYLPDFNSPKSHFLREFCPDFGTTMEQVLEHPNPLPPSYGVGSVWLPLCVVTREQIADRCRASCSPGCDASMPERPSHPRPPV